MNLVKLILINMFILVLQCVESVICICFITHSLHVEVNLITSTFYTFVSNFHVKLLVTRILMNFVKL